VGYGYFARAAYYRFGYLVHCHQSFHGKDMIRLVGEEAGSVRLKTSLPECPLFVYWPLADGWHVQVLFAEW